MDRTTDKGKAKLIHPTQSTRRSSPMSLSSEEDKTEKLMGQSIRAEKIQNLRQLPASLTDSNISIQVCKPSTRPPKNKHFTTRTTSYTDNTQNFVITFGNYALQRCNDPNKKFRPIIGMELTENNSVYWITCGMCKQCLKLQRLKFKY